MKAMLCKAVVFDTMSSFDRQTNFVFIFYLFIPIFLNQIDK